MRNESTDKIIPIIMYHSISQDATLKFKRFTVSPSMFANHMDYLHQHAYTPITVSQFIQIRSQDNSSLPERPIVITFDDAFADFYAEALPVLNRYNFTATLYVPTAFVGGTSLWLEHEKETMRLMLTWQQLLEINRQGIECGAHSHSHRRLNTLPRSTIREEIIKSKKILEDKLGQQVDTFAYPFGHYTSAIRKLVREAGYTSACTVEQTMSSDTTDPFALTRLMVNVDTDLTAFANLISRNNLHTVRTLYARSKLLTSKLFYAVWPR